METFGTTVKSLEVRTPLGLKVIPIRNIVYIEAVRKCSEIHILDCATIMNYHPLKWYEEYLCCPYFFRTHNSYIINCKFIDYYNYNIITLKDKVRIPLARNRVKTFRENILNLEL